MIKELTEYLMSTFYKHIGVQTVKYQIEQMINQQPTNRYIEVIIDDEPYLESSSNEGIMTIEYNIIILSKEDILTAQDNALHIALDVINRIDNQRDYNLSVGDYSFIGLADYTDDKAHGVRLSLKLIIPNPIDLCAENFDESKDINAEDTSNDITLSDEDECSNVTIVKNDNNNITLNPIKLK